MREGARKIGLAGAGCAVDDQVLTGADPVAGRQAGDLAALESGTCAVVEILQAGALLELGQFQQSREAAAFAVRDFAFDD